MKTTITHLSTKQLDYDVELLSPIYCLGECSFKYQTIENYQAIASEFKLNIDNLAGMLGCDQFRKSSKDAFTFAQEAATKCLKNSGISPKEIDVVVFASNCFSNGQEDELFWKMGAFLNNIECTNAHPVGISMLACATLVSGMMTAICQMNTMDNVSNILVVSVDLVKNDQNRFSGFALFSDASSAFILRKRPKGEAKIQIKDVLFTSSSEVMADPRCDKSMKLACVKQLFLAIHSTGICLAELNRVFTVNIFSPFLNYLISSSEISPEKIYAGKVGEYGHCLNSDIIINFTEYLMESKDSVSLGHYAMASFTLGLGSAVILNIQ